MITEADVVNFMRGIETVTNVVHVELMHMFAIADGRVAERNMYIPADLVHHHFAMYAATHRVVALRGLVKDVEVGQLLGTISVFQLLASVAALVSLIRSLQAGEAIALSCDQVALHKATMHIDLVVTCGVHCVNGDFVATQVRERDIQSDLQLLVDPGVNGDAMHYLDAQKLSELDPTEEHQNDGGDHRHDTARLASLHGFIRNLVVHIEVLQRGERSLRLRLQLHFAAWHIPPADAAGHGARLQQLLDSLSIPLWALCTLE
eukprot:CAMPEP_0180690842 /NCGR_PEP_ID=MMETSP1037_2-20121125/75222_1 /TAXON_ID=632150 /ORGANISM="Azadinium spinosum, Strain 3D9" /LENGTH=261 /DNA_ID=CAMNT_0022721761 /DNA_START=192 /DNA_END=974 /DNA_ORIENTATION=+